MAEIVRVLPCPRCGKPVRWDDAPWRPFCGKRCKLIDLGAWADGSYAVPGEPATSDDEETGRGSPRT